MVKWPLDLPLNPALGLRGYVNRVGVSAAQLGKQLGTGERPGSQRAMSFELDFIDTWALSHSGRVRTRRVYCKSATGSSLAQSVKKSVVMRVSESPTIKSSVWRETPLFKRTRLAKFTALSPWPFRQTPAKVPWDVILFLRSWNVKDLSLDVVSPTSVITSKCLL